MELFWPLPCGGPRLQLPNRHKLTEILIFSRRQLPSWGAGKRNFFAGVHHTLITYCCFSINSGGFRAPSRPETFPRVTKKCNFALSSRRSARRGTHRWTQRTFAHPALSFARRGAAGERAFAILRCARLPNVEIRIAF